MRRCEASFLARYVLSPSRGAASGAEKMFVHSINAMYGCVLFPARCSLSVGRMNGSEDCVLEAKRSRGKSSERRVVCRERDVFTFLCSVPFFCCYRSVGMCYDYAQIRCALGSFFVCSGRDRRTHHEGSKLEGYDLRTPTVTVQKLKKHRTANIVRSRSY